MDYCYVLPPDPKGILGTALSVKPLFLFARESWMTFFFLKKIAMLSDNKAKKQYPSRYWLPHGLKNTVCSGDGSKEVIKQVSFLNRFKFPVTIKKMDTKAKFSTVPASNQIFGNSEIRGTFVLGKLFQVWKSSDAFSCGQVLHAECGVQEGIIPKDGCLFSANIFHVSKIFSECPRDFIIWIGSWNLTFTAYLSVFGM